MAALSHAGPDEGPAEVEVVGAASGGREVTAIGPEAERLLRGELRQHGDWDTPPAVEVDRERGRVRVALRTARSEVVAGALHAAGARHVTVRIYPDAASRVAWTDWGREGWRLPPDARASVIGAVGPKPRVLMPLLAAFMVALSLERLGALPLFVAGLLFLLLMLLVFALAASVARNRIEWVRIDREGPRPGEQQTYL